VVRRWIGREGAPRRLPSLMARVGDIFGFSPPFAAQNDISLAVLFTAPAPVRAFHDDLSSFDNVLVTEVSVKSPNKVG
jgi:hypothetical protein